MPYKLLHLQDRPIILIELVGNIDFSTMQTIFQECEAIEQGELAGQHVYRIYDAHHSHVTFADLMQFVRYVQAGSRGLNKADNLTVVYVGATDWVKLVINAMQTTHRINAPIFATVDDAMMYAHIRIADTHEKQMQN